MPLRTPARPPIRGAVRATLDHLLWGAPDLDVAVADLQERSGVRADFGGHHPELGTHNALARLGERVFLEVIAPAPALPPGALARQLASLASPALLMWAARTDDAHRVAARAIAAGLKATVVPGHRARPGGEVARWTNVFVAGHGLGTLVPFFIQWEGDYHPAQDAPPGLGLRSFVIETPEPAGLRALLDSLDVEATVRKGRRDRLRATCDTPRGKLVLAGPE